MSVVKYGCTKFVKFWSLMIFCNGS